MTDIPGIDNLPQEMKETYGFRCSVCGEIWDAYQVPCQADVAIRTMQANKTCITCGAGRVLIMMPWRYDQEKAARRQKETTAC